MPNVLEIFVQPQHVIRYGLQEDYNYYCQPQHVRYCQQRYSFVLTCAVPRVPQVDGGVCAAAE